MELSEGRAHALWDAENREVAEFALTSLQRTPIGTLSATAFVVERRSLATPRFPPGALFRLARFEDRLERSPRLAFAGDYLVGPGAEGAVTSGGRAANEIAREIADNCSAVSVSTIRHMLWKMLDADHPMEAHKIDSRAVQFLGAGADAREGVESFLEKRPPRFTLKPSTDLPDFVPWWDEPEFS